MESEIPSFRDAKPHESWELVPLDELSLSGILQLRNRRFQVSGMRRRGNSCWHLVIASSDSGAAILAGISSLRVSRSNPICGKGLLHPYGVRNDVKTTACARNASEQAILYTIRPSEEQCDMAICAGTSSLRGA